MGIENIKTCPECGSTNITRSILREQVICKDCGLVYEPTVAIAKPRKVEYAKPVVA